MIFYFWWIRVSFMVEPFPLSQESWPTCFQRYDRGDSHNDSTFTRISIWTKCIKAPFCTLVEALQYLIFATFFLKWSLFVTKRTIESNSSWQKHWNGEFSITAVAWIVTAEGFTSAIVSAAAVFSLSMTSIQATKGSKIVNFYGHYR